MQYVLLSWWFNFDTGFTEHLLRSFVKSAPLKSALHEGQVETTMDNLDCYEERVNNYIMWNRSQPIEQHALQNNPGYPL